MTKQPLNDVLDECLTLLEEDQVTLEECLARYPQHAADLRPLLEIALGMRRVAPPTPTPAAFATGKRRMLQALAQKKRHQPSPPLRRRGWIAALLGERGGKPARRRAPAFQVALAAALVLVLLVSGGLFLRFWLGTTVTCTARLAAISGLVEVRPASSETWLPASSAQRLELGDRIRTGPLSAATLVFFDGSTTGLEAETEITIAQMISRRDGRARVITLYQRLGRSHNRVQRLAGSASRFEIETPTTIAVVRGTEFSVAVEADGVTQVAVWEGFVEVTARQKTVQVQPGEMTSVQPNLPPAPPIPAPARLPAEVFLSTPTPERSEPALSPSTELGVNSAEATPQPSRTPTPELTRTPVPQKPETAVPSATPTPIPSPTPTPSPVPPTPTEAPVPPPTPLPQPTEPLPPAPTETPVPPPTPLPPPTEPLPPTPTEAPAPPTLPPPPPTEPIGASSSQGPTEAPTATPMND